MFLIQNVSHKKYSHHEIRVGQIHASYTPQHSCSNCPTRPIRFRRLYGACFCQVTCQGQIIGAILAETKDRAQRAAKRVEVTYEDLEPIITIEVSNLSKFSL